MEDQIVGESMSYWFNLKQWRDLNLSPESAELIQENMKLRGQIDALRTRMNIVNKILES